MGQSVIEQSIIFGLPTVKKTTECNLRSGVNMKLYPNNRFSNMKKCSGVLVRGAFLISIAIGLSACGGSAVDTANALASLGNTGSTTNNSATTPTTTPTTTTTTTTIPTTTTSGSGSSGGTAPAPVAVSVNLSWSAPSTRLDNTAIVSSDIGGYHVYFGTDQASLQLLTDIADSTVTTFDTQALSSGTYYFAVSAYDSNGVEGRLSNIAQKVI